MDREPEEVVVVEIQEIADRDVEEMGGPFAAGPGGNCVCPQCDYKISHTPGQPCNQLTCPQCNIVLTRK